MRDFARIVNATDGRQVLYYVESDDGDQILHQIFQFDDCHCDIKCGFSSPYEEKNEAAAYAALEKANTETADNLIRLVVEFMGGESDA